jgi:hypothetical protein
MNVGYHRIDANLALRQRKASLTAARFDHAPAGPLKFIGDLIADQPLVLDNENDRRGESIVHGTAPGWLVGEAGRSSRAAHF